MIISADCIEGTSNPPELVRSERLIRSKKKKKVPAHRNAAGCHNEHMYKLCKNLLKLSLNKTKITWKCLLNEILKMDSETNGLPTNIVLIAKLNSIYINGRDQYNVLSNENDFLIISKLAKDNKCSFSIIVKYLKNEVFEQSLKQKYIDDLLKPNSVHLSITVFNDTCLAKDDTNTESPQTIVNPPRTAENNINIIKNFVSTFQENLTNLESYLNSLTTYNAGSSHFGYECNHCHRNIVGIRYSCSTCVNFDLCEMCEEISEQIHDESHLFLKIKTPILPQINVNSIEDNLNDNQALIYPDILTDYSINLSENKSISASIKTKEMDSLEEEACTSIYKNQNKKEPKPCKDKRGKENTKLSKAVYNVEAGSKITKIWKIRNNGNTPWSSHLTLRRITGNIEPVEEQYTLPVPLLKPGDEDVISITFKIPSDIKEETNFFSVWRFCYKEKVFGKPLNLSVQVKPSSTEELKSNKSQNDVCQGLHLSESDDELSNISENSVIYPACFNLDVPFLQPSASSFASLKSNEIITSQTCELDLVKIDKRIDYNCPYSESYLDSTSDSTDNCAGAKLKGHLRKLKEIKSSKRETKLKKIKTKPNKLGKCHGEILIPIPSNSIIEKIKNKNETSRLSSGNVPFCTLNPKNDSNKNVFSKEGTKKNTKANESNGSKFGKESSSSTSSDHSRSDKRKCAFDQFGNVILPNVGLVSRTITNICNMIANPGPSHNNDQTLISNDETMRNALQKLFEMGFCNETLNVELLIKNNFDIQRTVRELFFSIGNNLFSGTSPPTATSASSRSANISASPCQVRKPKSSFLVDSVD